MIQPPKIIICDSGISTALKNKVQTLDIGQGEIDNNCHGSVLSEVILKYGKNAELTSIKLLDECCESNIEVLYNALDVCSTIEADIICLPLAIDTYSVQAELHDMIKLLADQGKIIISALFNRREYSIPAVYPEVIGVRINITPKVDKYFFNSNCDVQVSIPTEPIIFEYKPGEYTILGGNSLACGIITAHVSEVFSKHGILSYAELIALLKNQTVDDIRIIHEHKTSQLCQNIKQTFEIGELKAEMLKFELFDENGPLYNQLLSKERINKFISALQNRFHTINHKTPMRLSDLESSHSLYEYILKQE